MSLYNKFWLLLNRKPPRRYALYLNIVLPWSVVGFLLSISVLFFSVVISAWSTINLSFGFWLVLSVLLVMPFLLAGSFYFFDKKWGYIDAIYTNYLKRREEKIEKIGNK